MSFGIVLVRVHQGRERIPRNSGPPTDDEPFRYEFAAPLGTWIIRGTLV